MTINITGQHVEITPPLKDYVHKKFTRVKDHIENITSAHVILSVEKLQQKAEINLHTNKLQLFASAIDQDMYAAIDAMMDKIQRQAIKHKEKIKSHKANKLTDNDLGADDED